jgi:hypothetical protein
MPKLIDLTGRQFSKWTVLERAANNKDNHTMWRCRCACGAEKTVTSTSLVAKKSVSCRGCSNKNFTPRTPIGSLLWQCLRSNARRRGHIFRITQAYALKILDEQNRRCALTGVELTMGHRRDTRTASNASIDRINPRRGYVKGNIQWTTKQANLIKRDLSMTDFALFCENVVNHANEPS